LTSTSQSNIGAIVLTAGPAPSVCGESAQVPLVERH
jgi:hypothetical protein